MSIFSWLLSSPAVERLGWTLIHSVWEGAAAAIVLGLLLGSGLRRASAKQRYVACSSALAVLIAGLGVTFCVVRVSSPPRESAVIASAPPRTLNGGEIGRTIFDSDRPMPHDMRPTQIAVASAADQEAAQVKPESAPPLALRPALVWLCGIWACGVFLLSLFHTASFIGIQRLRVLGTSAVEESIAQAARRLATQLGIGGGVRVLRSLYARVPMVIGWLKPVILIPAAVASGLPARQIELILAHELAHIRRHDYLVNLLQVMAETLLFYHPAVWWISKRIRLERELCCDEAAVEACGGDRCGYVESLAALEELRGAELAMAAVGSGGGELLARARRLLGAGDEVGRRGARVGLAVAGIVCLVLLIVVIRLHAAPAVEKPVDAAGLVREVREAEGWVDRVQSFSLTMESGDKFPVMTEMGRDEKRFYYRSESKEDLRQFTWDGMEAVSHSKYIRKEQTQEHFSFGKEPFALGETFALDLPIPHAGPHTSRWAKDHHVVPDMYGGDPEDFHLVGREKFRGIDCFVLESDLRYRTLYVGVADHRLYGKMNRVQTKFSLNSREAVGGEIAKEMGHEVKNGKELDDWLLSLSPDDAKRYWKESFKRLRRWSRPQMTNWYEDYKEIAPGCWLPMHQGTDLWNVQAGLTVEPKIISSSELKVTKATVNQPIPDQRFVWELTEGADVQDSRYDPMLRYKYKKHFEPEEWRAILDEAAEQKAHLRPTNNLRQGEVYSSTEALGKPAPEFPLRSNWINSDPMKMADLKGKIVLIEFWANWSKFSRPDIAKLNAQFERGEKDVVVVSVHAAGTSEADLRKWVKEYGIKYPVCIDSPSDKGGWKGSLFNAYHVMEVPMTFVIDRQGKIKSWSSAASAIVGAHQAATQPASPSSMTVPAKGR